MFGHQLRNLLRSSLTITAGQVRQRKSLAALPRLTLARHFSMEPRNDQKEEAKNDQHE